MLTLSKSDFKAGRSCPTKLFYREAGCYPTTLEDDPYLQMLAAGGYMVEELAKARYPLGVEMPSTGDPVAASAATMEMLHESDCATLFGATFLAGRLFARVDILEKRGNEIRLIEVKAKSVDGSAALIRVSGERCELFWSKRGAPSILAEWEPYLADLTFQAVVLSAMFPTAVISPYMCMVDKTATTSMEGLPQYFSISHRLDRSGNVRLVNARILREADRLADEALTIEIAVGAEVAFLLPAVKAEIDTLEQLYGTTVRREQGPLQLDCKDCEFRVRDIAAEFDGFRECWKEMAQQTPSVLDVYAASRLPDGLVDEMISSGNIAINTIPTPARVALASKGGPQSDRQSRQIENTITQSTYIGGGLADTLRGVTYPLHFVDFEAARMAIPHHAGMRPYGQVAFQWSCHTQAAPGGAWTHTEWLHADRDWPNERFARALREVLADVGTVLTWSHFEATTLRAIADELRLLADVDADLVAWLDGVAAKESKRILDLERVTSAEFFHPGMGGQTSIKAVFGALWRSDSMMRGQFTDITGESCEPGISPYLTLPPIVIAGRAVHVQEGTGAIRAYEAMMFGAERDDLDTHASWRTLLLQYCRLDTLAMVLIWEYWRRATSSGATQPDTD